MDIIPLDIANMALGVLDEAPIDSLDQDVKPARLLNLHFDLTREAELTKHAWCSQSWRPPSPGPISAVARAR
ncbi:hypothetical protein [Mesorhizobium escarrei]|uniref:Uncharacterized protein n=1 Tax=Mesorhizobium escarrei TaxID=666018 RepID=A0ABM9DH39_9HYPH|nr:hypothetical protein [Mesorhizobium escarrei]CAH2395901.1 hypothetical protein MES5069_1270006 [Mesorhizobium escarrei]